LRKDLLIDVIPALAFLRTEMRQHANLLRPASSPRALSQRYRTPYVRQTSFEAQHLLTQAIPTNLSISLHPINIQLEADTGQTRCMSQLSSRTMSPMSKSMESTSNWPCGTQLARKTTTAFVRCHTQIPTSSSSASPSTLLTRLTTSKRRYGSTTHLISQSKISDKTRSGFLKSCTSAKVSQSF
jgi:hypothetical protein